jgi:SnoaL-like domain
VVEGDTHGHGNRGDAPTLGGRLQRPRSGRGDEFFTDDAVQEMPRGPHPWGRRLQGREEVRAGLASRFAGIPDVHYGDDRHWVSGDRGCSEWLLTGTSTQGDRVEVRGCDLFEFEATRSPGRIPTGSSWSAEALPETTQAVDRAPRHCEGPAGHCVCSSKPPDVALRANKLTAALQTRLYRSSYPGVTRTRGEHQRYLPQPAWPRCEPAAVARRRRCPGRNAAWHAARPGGCTPPADLVFRRPPTPTGGYRPAPPTRCV